MTKQDTNNRELRGELDTLIYEVTDLDDVVKQLADLLLPLIAQVVNKAFVDGAKAYNIVLTENLGKPTYMNDNGQRHTVYKQEWVSKAIQTANQQTISALTQDRSTE